MAMYSTPHNIRISCTSCKNSVLHNISMMIMMIIANQFRVCVRVSMKNDELKMN